MAEQGVSIDHDVEERLERWKKEWKSVVLLVVQQENESDGFTMAAIFSVADLLRPEAPAVISISTSQRRDNQTMALAVARKADISPSNKRDFYFE